MNPRAQEYLRRRFVGADDFLALPDIPRHEFLAMILPRQHRAVMTECLWFGGGPTDFITARMAFCADTQMARVFDIKAETNGANTCRFGNVNCHIWPCPELEDQPGLAFVEDRVLQYFEWQYRLLDMEQAAETNERHAIVKLNEATVTASGLILPSSLV